MVNNRQQGIDDDRELFLDITAEVCPLTFVRTKLLIEAMKPGQTAEIRLRGNEPLRNVPRAVTSLGHTILSLDGEATATDSSGIHRLRIRKNAR